MTEHNPGGRGFPTGGELRRHDVDVTAGEKEKLERPSAEDDADVRGDQEDVVVAGNLIIEGDVVVAGSDETEDEAAREEGFPTEAES